MQVAILGAGAWGTALAMHCQRAGHAVRLWGHPPAQILALQRDRENPLLPGFQLPAEIAVHSELEPALRGAELVLVVVPSHVLRELLVRAKPYWPAACPIVSATKGIEDDSLMLMDEVIEDVLGASCRERTLVLSGPSFAREVAASLPTNLVLAAQQVPLAEQLQKVLATDRLRVYTSTDVQGVQVGGALKNVIAIAVGAADGLGLGHNARAGLITRGLNEIGRLAQAKGGDPHTVSGLAGLGDLVLTCTGDLSRNRTVGFELGRGARLQDVLAQLGHVAEGVVTAKSTHALAQRLQVELPISEQVYQVLFENKPPAAAVRDLLQRPLRRE
ncbi:MAG TPA: NAD(P)H-dependent glycerol-3-phosphate dehydrogenase [Polyangiaceae bacterium]|nr:NAD(P)H-dependent glycerol-3-phosphate dehydrogenase [Polyangiaceae bacterium]